MTGSRPASLWAQLGCRYEAALALLGSGQEAALRDALGIFADLGATAAAAITRQAMRERGCPFDSGRAARRDAGASARADPA